MTDLPLPDLIEAPRSWPPVVLAHETRDDLEDGESRVEGSLATVVIRPGMAGLVDRGARTATLVSPVPWSPASIVHPFLAAPGALFAWWSGRAALHGGAFVGARSEAWALLAPKGGGKSTTLGRLAASGVTVLADDLVVVDAGSVLAGPRCVDLPTETVSLLGLEDAVSADARHAKHRLTLPPVAPATRLAGVVLLEWGDDVLLDEVPGRDRPATLLRHLMLWPRAEQPAALMDVMALPMLRLRRPRDPASLPAVADRLLGLAG